MPPATPSPSAGERSKLPSLVCPRCHGALHEPPGAYACAACSLEFPILHGIPDFRLRSDAYLSLEAERAKAQRLAEHPVPGFAERLAHYYTITDDVTPAQAQRFMAYNHNGPVLARSSLERLQPRAGQRFLDLGCGSGGGLLAAADSGATLIGVDIALRWLVLCKSRLEEQGVEALLVCADVEALPFAPGSFDRLLANDLLENVYDVPKALESMAQAMAPGAELWASGSNKYGLGPHPSTRLWCVGFLPRRLRSALLSRLRGVDSLRHVQLIAPLGLARLARRLGLQSKRLAPKQIPTGGDLEFAGADRFWVGLYARLSRLPLLAELMLLLGPAFEIHLAQPSSPTERRSP